MRTVVQQLRQVALRHAGKSLADGELLEAFLARRDEAAFEALLRRHGPMVLAVCRRVLRHEQDAEDAFQATFLVLARKAASVRPRDMVGPWLHGVAHRTALSARTMSAKRRVKERRARELPRPNTPAEEPSEELLAQLDAALARLPDRYRVPVLLCELQGRSRKEVARTLGLPEGTLSWRLAHAKKLLARRLSRYGAVLTTAGLASALGPPTASAKVPATLLNTTVRAALGVVAGESLKAEAVSAHVIALTEGVLKAMLLTKIKGMLAVAFVLAVGIGAIGLTYGPVAAQPAGPGGGSRSARAVADELDELRLEVAALRKGLQATRERVRALEEEVETLRARRMGGPSGPPGGGAGIGFAPGGGGRGMRPGGGGGQPMGPGRGQPGARPGGTREPGDSRNPGALWRGGADPRGGGDVPSVPGTGGTPGGLGNPQASKLDQRDPLADAEAAIRQLRQHPDDQKAMDALERGLKRLRNRQGMDAWERALRDLQGQNERPKAGTDPTRKE